MSDLASFDNDTLQSIWGEYPRCILSGETMFTEYHHIHGRGGKYDRKIHSSILNACPLTKNIHAYAPLHDPELAHFFQMRIYRKLMEKGYNFTEIDQKFLEKFPL